MRIQTSTKRQRNFLGVDDVKLHKGSGAKALVERYQEKVKECLRFISGSPDMSKADKYVCQHCMCMLNPTSGLYRHRTFTFSHTYI